MMDEKELLTLATTRRTITQAAAEIGKEML